MSQDCYDGSIPGYLCLELPPGGAIRRVMSDARVCIKPGSGADQYPSTASRCIRIVEQIQLFRRRCTTSIPPHIQVTFPA